MWLLKLSFFLLTFVQINASSTLKLLQIVYRHGDKTADAKTSYPTDPYANDSWRPYGPGQLTQRGMQQMYNVGRELRVKYQGFLGEGPSGDIVKSITTDFDRVRTSSQVLLSGLLPPAQDEIFVKDLNWQPFPASYTYLAKDTIFLPFLTCPNFIKLYRNISFPRGATELEVFNYISVKTGREMKDHIDISRIYDCLQCQDKFGYPLPLWTRLVYPDALQVLTLEALRLLTSTLQLKKLLAGQFLQEIIKETQGLVPGRKLVLYGGHQSTIVMLLGALGVYTPHIPAPAAYMTFELHQVNGVYGLKVFYKDDPLNMEQSLKLPGCELFCPLDTFIGIANGLRPEKDSCGLGTSCRSCSNILGKITQFWILLIFYEVYNVVVN